MIQGLKTLMADSNPLDYPTISTRIWNNRTKRALAISIAWQPFPNATGWNEVPRAGGGVIWDAVAGTERDYRDYKIGQDAAAGTRKEIVAELLEALADAGWLKEDKSARAVEDRAQDALYTDPKPLAGTTVASLLALQLP